MKGTKGTRASTTEGAIGRPVKRRKAVGRPSVAPAVLAHSTIRSELRSPLKSQGNHLV